MNKLLSIRVNVNEHETLSSNISEEKKHLIEELSVMGYYNCDYNDDFIKSICNSINEDGIRTGGHLKVLNLSGARIYYSRKANYGSLRSDSFSDCITLQKVIFSEIVSVSPSCFSGCISLESIETAVKCPYQSNCGILYRVGEYDSSNRLRSFDKYHLVKYPAAKKETKDIDFDSINTIEDYAFEDFTGTDLYLSVTPPSCSIKAFYNVDITKIKIHVPKESADSYWMHPVWGTFQIVPDND